MKRYKILLSMISIICFCMVLSSCMPISLLFLMWRTEELYPEITEPRDFVFSPINDGTAYEVTTGEITPNGVTVIPATYNGLPVTRIGTFAFFNCVTLQSVTIPEGILSIGVSSFYNCKSLTKIQIPSSVIALGYSSIYPDATNNLATSAIDIPSIAFSPAPPPPEGVFRDCISLTSVQFAEQSMLKSIGEYAFSGCTMLDDIELPSSVEIIASYAFSGCTALTTIHIPQNVSDVGVSTWEYCTNLESVSFDQDGLLGYLSASMFQSCTKLVEFEIPASVSTIERLVFFECINLMSLTVAAGNTVFRDEANCIIAIETNELVLGCKTSAIPEQITSIGEYAFEGSSLTSVDIPTGVQKIGMGAFAYCRDLTKAIIPDGKIARIEAFTFYNCQALKEIIVPLSVKAIGNSAFYYCTSLKSAQINGVVTIGESAFNRCSALSQLVLPQGLKIIGGDAFYWCSSLTSIHIPSSVTSIGDRAFVGCDRIEQFTISQDVKGLVIGIYSLSGCQLIKSMVIPNGVVSIGSNAFAHCWKLRQIEIPASVVTMGSHVFTGCSNLKIYVKAASKPSGWHDSWNADDSSSSGAERTRKVIWDN